METDSNTWKDEMIPPIRFKASGDRRNVRWISSNVTPLAPSDAIDIEVKRLNGETTTFPSDRSSNCNCISIPLNTINFNAN